MSEEPKRKSHAKAWVWSILAVLLLYVAGLGPYGALLRNDTIGFSTHGNMLQTIYFPLSDWLAKTPLKEPMERYIQWWEYFLGPGKDRE